MTIFAGFDTRDIDRIVHRTSPALAELRGARIFVTGGTGFFGRWILASIAHAARHYDLSLVALTRDASAFAHSAPDLANHPAIRLLEGDVRTFSAPPGRFSHIIHAATDTSTGAAADISDLLDTIVNGSARVLQFARASGVRRLLYISSGAVYGPQVPLQERIAEDYQGAPATLEPESAYGHGKRVAEILCMAARDAGIASVVARAFAFVGPGMPLNGHFAIGNFIADAVAGRAILIKGDGETVRSYLYAGDLTAWLLILLAQAPPYRAYNVGSDEAFSLREVATRVAAHAPAAVPVRILQQASNTSRQRYVPCIARARSLGLDVWTSLDDAIRSTMAHALR